MRKAPFAAALAAAALAASGVVFERIGPAAGASAPAGREVLRRDVAVNGVPGELRALLFDPADTEAAAAALFPEPDAGDAWDPRFSKGARPGGGIRAVAWIPGSAGSVALVFESDREPADGGAVWPFADIPAPAGLAPGFSAVLSPRAAACSGSADLAPEAALAALRGSLEAGGWRAVSPAAERTSCSVWARGRAVALACASRGSDGSAVWLVLRREPETCAETAP